MKSTNKYYTPNHHPIHFKAGMLKAIIDGTKTETRRLVKPQPTFPGGVAAIPVGRGTHSCAIYPSEIGGAGGHFFKARCQPGDLFWVKERKRQRKDDSPITLRVTRYSIERLHDIDEAGAVAEGYPIAEGLDDNGNPATWSKEMPHESGIGFVAWECGLDWYVDLWNNIYGPDAWDKNPWVEVIKFDVIKRNILEVEA